MARSSNRTVPKDATHRRQNETTRLTTRTLLAITVAALFAISYSSAFSVLQPSSRTSISDTRPGRTVQNRKGPSAAVAVTAPKRSRATTLLLVTPPRGEEDESPSTRLALGRRLRNWKDRMQSRKTKTANRLAKIQRRRTARALATTLVSAGSVAAVLGRAPAPASASQVVGADPDAIIRHSIRPGVNRAQAERLYEGDMPDEVRSEVDAKTSVGVTGAVTEKEITAREKQKVSMYGDDYDDYDDEDFSEEYGDFATNAVKPSNQRQSFGSTVADSTSEIARGTKSVFSGISDDVAVTKPKSLYVKIAVGIFVPVFGSQLVRHVYRYKKEERDVALAVEIMDQQRAKYFGVDKDGKNVTKTEDKDKDDDDSEDEGGDDVDSAEDDDDDGDDEDDDDDDY